VNFMDHIKFEKYLESLSDSEMAQQLAEDIKKYKSTLMDTDNTISIPDLNNICMMADELSKRLAS